MISNDTVPTVKVWDVVVRITHWLLVAGVALAWYTSSGFGVWHDYIGYTVLAIVIVRVGWGFTGSKYARFSQFVRSVGYTARYAKNVVAGNQRRYIGHNPLAGWMAVALLTMVFLVCATGWLYTTDTYWGVEWVINMHTTLTYILFVLIALHILGAIFTSLHHGENLITAMIHGRKCGPRMEDINPLHK